MKIIISPAKKMNHREELYESHGKPLFIDKTEQLKSYLSGLGYEEVKAIWRCNDKIAELNYQRLQQMDLHNRLTPAVLAYEGLQYQYMAPQVFDQQQWQYVTNHLVILSGFYGMLRPTDGVTPYRLEMQAKINLTKEDGEITSLYDYWGESIYRSLIAEDQVILNLASKEYSKAIEKYLTSEIRYITCVFGEETKQNGARKIKTKATQAKMARGEMVRYLAQHHIEDIEGVKAFSALSYRYSSEDSDENTLVFIKS